MRPFLPRKCMSHPMGVVSVWEVLPGMCATGFFTIDGGLGSLDAGRVLAVCFCH